MLGALASIAGNVLGGLIGDRSARRAAQTQADAERYATDAQTRQFDLTREDQAPWREAGVRGLNALEALLPQINRNYTLADIQADPIYRSTFQTGLDQGRNALMRQLSAGGNRNSGAAAKALTRFGQDYASQQGTSALQRIWGQQGNQFNRLASMAGIGQTANQQLQQAGQNFANNVGNIAMSGANARGASQIARGNAWTNAIGQGFNAWQQNQMMNRLAPPPQWNYTPDGF